MRPNFVPIETAFTFIEVLDQTERERDELSFYEHQWSDTGAQERFWDETERVELIANATWVSGLIDAKLLASIEKDLQGAPLQVRLNAFSGTAAVVTPGILDNLKDRVVAEKRKSLGSSDGVWSTIGDRKLYLAMIREGVVDWTIRRTDAEGYEVRCCLQCGKWFEPQLKSRSRFCSPRCRKTFNNRRTSTDQSASTFVCGGCKENRPIDDFTGLRFQDPERKTATPLRMGAYSPVEELLCCADCVRLSYPEWRRYIAPMESLSERATA